MIGVQIDLTADDQVYLLIIDTSCTFLIHCWGRKLGSGMPLRSFSSPSFFARLRSRSLRSAIFSGSQVTELNLAHNVEPEPQTGWNVTDFVIVTMSLVEMLLSFNGINLSVLRLIRMIRVTRLVSLLERLNVLVMAFSSALTSVAWVFLLLLLGFFMAGVLATSLFGHSDKLDEDPSVDVAAWFGTLPRLSLDVLSLDVISVLLDTWRSLIIVCYHC